MPARKGPTDSEEQGKGTDSESPSAKSNSSTKTHTTSSSRKEFTPENASTVGELPDANADHLSDTLDRVSVELETEIKEMPNVVELVSLQDQIKQMKQQLRELKKLRRQEKDAEAVILSYSRVTRANLHERLGVKPFEVDIKMETFRTVMTKVKEAYLDPSNHQPARVMMYTPKNWPHKELRKSVEFIEKTVVLRSETSTRILVDRYLLAALQFLDKEGQRATNKFQGIIAPEFAITAVRANEQASFAVIKYRDLTTGLCGVTDYIVLSEHGSRRPAVEPGTSVVKIKQTVEKVKPGDPVPPYTAYRKNTDDAGVLIVEVKKIQTEDLHAHVPQAAAECISIFMVDSTRSSMPFILTSGREWIFGILAKCATPPTSANPELYETFLSPIFVIETKDIKQHQPGAEADVASYPSFVETFVIWIKALPDQIRDMFRATLENAASAPESTE